MWIRNDISLDIHREDSKRTNNKTWTVRKKRKKSEDEKEIDIHISSSNVIKEEQETSFSSQLMKLAFLLIIFLFRSYFRPSINLILSDRTKRLRFSIVQSIDDLHLSDYSKSSRSCLSFAYASHLSIIARRGRINEKKCGCWNDFLSSYFDLLGVF